MTSQTEGNKKVELDLSAYHTLFLEQAATFLALLRKSLVQLQDTPTDNHALREGRRATHTLRGMSAMMRYESLVALAERLEQPFLRELPMTHSQINILLEGCDEFEASIEQLDKGDKH